MIIMSNSYIIERLKLIFAHLIESGQHQAFEHVIALGCPKLREEPWVTPVAEGGVDGNGFSNEALTHRVLDLQ